MNNLRKWPAELRQPLFVAGAAAYLLLSASRRWLHWPLPRAVAHQGADLLALPLMLTVLLCVMRRFYFRQPTFTLPTAWIVSTWLSTSVLFEGLLPLLRPAAATADWRDVLAYALGGLVYARWLNRPA